MAGAGDLSGAKILREWAYRIVCAPEHMEDVFLLCCYGLRDSQVVSKMVTFDPTVRISVADTLRLKQGAEELRGQPSFAKHRPAERA